MSVEFFKPRESEKTLSELAGDKLDFLLGETKKRGSEVLLLLSGGSSLSLLSEVNPSSLNSRTTVTVLDERYSSDPMVNNMAQIMETDFYKKSKALGVQVIDTRVKNNETRDELAQRFNEGLIDWLAKNQDGVIIATIGMGPDGHISGIMPFSEDPEKFRDLFDNGNENNLVVGYDVGDKNPYSQRVTTTMNMLRRINKAVAYISGENKRSAWSRLTASEGSLAATPARILNEITGDVFVFTDL
ncbi:MAG: 6-phosphogluconolactonase [Candidatus Levybacteria bacterium]|nr:6-phosphogluconolactonase [Candidatus Levybacteria bacterium]